MLLCASVLIGKDKDDVIPIDSLAAFRPLFIAFLKGAVVYEMNLNLLEISSIS